LLASCGPHSVVIGAVQVLVPMQVLEQHHLQVQRSKLRRLGENN